MYLLRAYTRPRKSTEVLQQVTHKEKATTTGSYLVIRADYTIECRTGISRGQRPRLKEEEEEAGAGRDHLSKIYNLSILKCVIFFPFQIRYVRKRYYVRKGK